MNFDKIIEFQGGIDLQERRETLKEYENAVVQYMKTGEDTISAEVMDSFHKKIDSVVEEKDFAIDFINIIVPYIKFIIEQTANSEVQEIQKLLEENIKGKIVNYLNQLSILFKLRELQTLYEREKKQQKIKADYRNKYFNNKMLRELMMSLSEKRELPIDSSMEEQIRSLPSGANAMFHIRENVRDGKRNGKISLSPKGRSACKYFHSLEEKSYSKEEMLEQIYQNNMYVIDRIDGKDRYGKYKKTQLGKKRERILCYRISQVKSQIEKESFVVDLGPKAELIEQKSNKAIFRENIIPYSLD